jgi:hypothetical protein
MIIGVLGFSQIPDTRLPACLMQPFSVFFFLFSHFSPEEIPMGRMCDESVGRSVGRSVMARSEGKRRKRRRRMEGKMDSLLTYIYHMATWLHGYMAHIYQTACLIKINQRQAGRQAGSRHYLVLFSSSSASSPSLPPSC